MPIFAYAIALLIAAGTLALSVDLATKPDIEPQQQVAANTPVRQIPLGKTSHDKTSLDKSRMSAAAIRKTN